MGCCQRRLCLRQPERHISHTIQSDGGGQCRAGLLPLFRLQEQGAQATVTLGLEWAHTKFLGQGQTLAGVCFGLFGLRRLAPHSDLAEEVQRPCLISPLPALTAAVEDTLRELGCLCQMPD